MQVTFLIATLILLGHVAPARAASAPAPIAPSQAATAVRLQVAMPVLHYGGVGVQVSRRLVPHLALDVTLNRVDLGRDHAGPMMEVMARAFLFPGRHGFSFAAGMAGLSAREYGALAFLQAELAYELRAHRAPSVLIAIGPQVALNESGTATCAPGTGWCRLLWKDHYAAGDTAVQLRLAMGYSF
jgi:hypothetical protein